LKKNDIKAVIFDMGGTLLDYDPIPWEEMKKIRSGKIRDFLAAKGYSFTLDDIEKKMLDGYYEMNSIHAERTLVEVNLAECVKTGLRALGVSEDYSLWIIKLMHRSLKDNLIIFEDSLNTLKQLSARYTLGLISNTTIPGVYFAEDLDEIGMSNYFKHMLFTADLGMRKPHSSVFERMLELLGVAAEKSLYVGDSFKNDVYGPSLLGMKTAWINPGGKPVPAEYPGVRPDFVIKSIGGLLSLI